MSATQPLPGQLTYLEPMLLRSGAGEVRRMMLTRDDATKVRGWTEADTEREGMTRWAFAQLRDLNPRQRPAAFRSPEQMAALSMAESVSDHLAGSGGSLTIGPALDRLCAVVPDTPEPVSTYRGQVIDLQAVRDSIQIMPDRPNRASGWTTLALIALVAAVFIGGMLR